MMSTLGDVSVAVLAEGVARQYHGEDANQHNGEPYITHVERVVEHLARLGAPEHVLAVAWLHDVVEDTSVDLADLRAWGFQVQIVEAVDAISHRKGETRADYYERVGANFLALMVKMSDLRDNTDPARRECLAPATRERLREKYERAHRALGPWIIHHQLRRA